MREKKLDTRLAAVASFVNVGSAVADIGSDHGYLPLYLLSRGICTKALAGDIGQGPLDSARKNSERYGFTESLKLRLYDGIPADIIGEYDTFVIAGLGGLSIKGILSKVISELTDVRAHLILQPMTEQAALREFLINNGYKIDCELYPTDGKKIYNVLNCYSTREKTDYDEIDLILGKPETANSKEEYINYAKYIAAFTEKAVKSGGSDKKALLDLINKRIEEIENYGKDQ